MMQMQIQIPKIVDETIVHPQEQKQPLTNDQKHQEAPYRWVIIALTGLALLLNGFANNAITPIEHKMTLIYGVSETKVSLSVILSFFVFFIANFPANKIIDTKGLRVGLIIGTSLYFLGTALYILINVSYYFVLLGTICCGLGQPFLVNTPAKVAAFWFFPKNRALATAIMVGINLLSYGFGFMLPTIVVQQQSQGDEARQQIKHLYIFYFIYAGVVLILSLLFMQAKPQIPPSQGATAHKSSSIRQALLQVKRNRNLWMFFGGYFLCYGTLVTFGANCNFIIKPYGYTDFQIAINAIVPTLSGTIGAVVFSAYIKKTFNYKKAISFVTIGAAIMLIILCIWLNTANAKVITTIILFFTGFIYTPIVPLCYDLGCQLTFPMGQAQVIGFLNGGGLLWAFLASAFVTSVFGYGSESSSMIIMGILSVFAMLAAALFFFVKIDLKRRTYEMQQNLAPAKYQIEMTQGQGIVKEISVNEEKTEAVSGKEEKYGELIEEPEGSQQKEEAGIL